MTDKNHTIDIDRIAKLARLELTDEEKAKLQDKLANVLENFEQLESVDVSNVEPTAHAFSVYNVWDKDEAGPTFTPDEALSNAPQKKEGYVVVPQVVE